MQKLEILRFVTPILVSLNLWVVSGLSGEIKDLGNTLNKTVTQVAVLDTRVSEHERKINRTGR